LHLGLYTLMCTENFALEILIFFILFTLPAGWSTEIDTEGFTLRLIYFLDLIYIEDFILGTLNFFLFCICLPPRSKARRTIFRQTWPRQKKEERDYRVFSHVDDDSGLWLRAWRATRAKLVYLYLFSVLIKMQ